MTVPLSQCATYRTDTGSPYGRITAVRCPDLIHCLHFAPVTHGCIGAHVSNVGWRCRWIGSVLIDDRDSLAGRRYITRDDITVLLTPGSRTRGALLQRAVSACS